MIRRLYRPRESRAAGANAQRQALCPGVQPLLPPSPAPLIHTPAHPVGVLSHPVGVLSRRLSPALFA
jgi:hypothetical protein